MTAPSSATALLRSPGVTKALKITTFCVALVLGVVAALAVLVHFAGGCGIPYFSFTTTRGSECVNTFGGFRCSSLTLEDVDYFGGLELPAAARVVSSDYESTHDYRLNAVVEVPGPAARSALTALADAFGPCDKGRRAPINSERLSKLCVMANDTAITRSGVPDSRVYVVATGLRRDDTRVISLSVRSR